MPLSIPRRDFFFLRHAQTDHNIHLPVENSEHLPLNEYGKKQAEKIRPLLSSLHFHTVSSSPLLRVQQTKEIALAGIPYKDYTIPNLQECSRRLWVQFEAMESGASPSAEVLAFFHSLKPALEMALSQKDPVLMIAHGGTFWTLCYFLNISGSKRIENCSLAHFFFRKNQWEKKILNDIAK